MWWQNRWAKVGDARFHPRMVPGELVDLLYGSRAGQLVRGGALSWWAPSRPADLPHTSYLKTESILKEAVVEQKV